MSMLPLALLVVLGATTGREAGPQVTTSSMPWLRGLSGAVYSDTGRDDVAERMAAWTQPDDSCPAAAYPGLELQADVAPAPGLETLLASYTQGLVVLGSERQLLAASPGYTCEGSADELAVIGAGYAGFDRTIAVAVTSGGRTESVTWLALFRIGHAGRLDPVFTAAVELRAGDELQRGAVTLIPGGLLYRAPTGGTSVWLFDPGARAYTWRGSLDPAPAIEDPPHAAPPLARAF
jgi:hypothetical protein